MTQGQAAQGHTPLGVGSAQTRRMRVVAMMVGLIGLLIGGIVGWLLRRDRVEQRVLAASTAERDRTVEQLHETSARLESADRSLVELRTTLTETEHRLEHRQAAVARLQYDLAECRDELGIDQTQVVDPTMLIVTADDDGVPADTVERSLDDTDPLDTATRDDDHDHDHDADTTMVLPVADPTVDISAIRPSAAQDPFDAALDEADVTEEVVVRPPPSVETPAQNPSDDLKRIHGVGPALERLLNDAGVTTFRQLAVLDEASIEALGARLPRFSGRIRRDGWVEQARRLHVETHGDHP